MEKEKRNLKDLKLAKNFGLMIISIFIIGKMGEYSQRDIKYYSNQYGHFINEYTSTDFKSLDNPNRDVNYKTYEEVKELGQSIVLIVHGNLIL